MDAERDCNVLPDLPAEGLVHATLHVSHDVVIPEPGARPVPVVVIAVPGLGEGRLFFSPEGAMHIARGLCSSAVAASRAAEAAAI